MRRTHFTLVEPVGIDQCRRLGQLGRAFVVIDHDHVDPGIMRHQQRLVRHRAAIDGDDQAGALLGQPHQRFARRSIAFEQAVRDVILRFQPQRPQQPDQQSRAGCAIDVIVAVDRRCFAGQHGLRQAFGGGIHVAQLGWIGQEAAQRRIAVPLDVVSPDPARQQKLRHQVMIEARPIAEVHVATAPAPDTARDRAAQAEDR